MVFYRSMILLFALVCLSLTASADENLFQKYNPDIDKYEFAKNFIISLSYYDRVARRLETEIDLQNTKGLSVARIQDLINNRTMDNTELRIAKNYLGKFTTSQNAFVQKVAKQAIDAYELLLSLSMRERDLWQQFYLAKNSNDAPSMDEGALIHQQTALAFEKKEVAKNLLEASVLLKVVLLSGELCEDENCQDLVLTDKERDKLSSKLDSFARANVDWGIKAGQSTLQACVASIREVLEDNVYRSRP